MRSRHLVEIHQGVGERLTPRRHSRSPLLVIRCGPLREAVYQVEDADRKDEDERTQEEADMSQFQAGGSTIHTVHVKKVNLPDGTSLTVALSFTPIGSMTLNRGEGSLSADLGHCGVSRDAVEVRNGAAVVLKGAYLQ